MAFQKYAGISVRNPAVGHFQTFLFRGEERSDDAKKSKYPRTLISNDPLATRLLARYRSQRRVFCLNNEYSVAQREWTKLAQYN